MSPNMPIHRSWIETDRMGRVCKIEILIEQTGDCSKYPPDGKKCVFRLIRERTVNSSDFELILLVDNHVPFGYHSHDKLPLRHNSRRRLAAMSWRDAWIEFQKMIKELLDGQA